MKVVILADKYSNETIEKIIEYYNEQSYFDFIICVSNETEAVEVLDYESSSVVVVKLPNRVKSGGRLLRISSLLDKYEPFLLTFGDYFCDIEVDNLIEFHKNQGRVLSMALIKQEKENIFGGIMLVDTDALGYINTDGVVFERDVISRLGEEDEISWYYYSGKPKSIYQKMKIYRI